MSKPLAYSYVRFSTPEQAKGDSARRQTDGARAYCEKHGLELDTSLRFHDKGVSAFKGANAETGRLADFLRAVEDGVVAKGSYLIVENLDRISRQSARKAVRTLENIVEAGVAVVTLSDGRTYTEESLDASPLDFMLALMSFIRANEESEMKAKRVRAAWSKKRDKAASLPLTARCPAWLKLRADRSGFDVVPDRAQIVRDVYEMAARGVGQHGIARALNKRGVPTWGDSTRKAAVQWHRSYIVKLLSTPAVIGTFTPHFIEHVDGKKVRRPVDPVPGYYPTVVEPEVYQAAQSRRTRVNRSGGFKGRNTIKSIFASLARCPLCGATMTRTTKSSKAMHPNLVCTKAKAGVGCKYRAVRLEPIETSFLAEAPQILFELGSGYASTDTDPTVEVLRARRSELERGIYNLLAEVERGSTSGALTKRIAKLEADLVDVQAELTTKLAALDQRSAALARSRLEQAATDLRQLAVARTVLAGLGGDMTEEDRSAAVELVDIQTAVVNSRLHEVLSEVVVDYRRGVLGLHWKFGESTEHVYDWSMFWSSEDRCTEGAAAAG